MPIANRTSIHERPIESDGKRLGDGFDCGFYWTYYTYIGGTLYKYVADAKTASREEIKAFG